jgi:hypothetical protein
MAKKKFESTVNSELGKKLDALKLLLSDTDKDGKIEKNGKAVWGDVVTFLFNHYESENLTKVSGTRKIQTYILKILHTKNSTQTITTNQIYTKLKCNKNSIKEVMGWYLPEITAHHKNLGWTAEKIAKQNQPIIEHKAKK